MFILQNFIYIISKGGNIYMKYHITEQKGLFYIKFSGGTKKNEPVLAKKMLLPYLKRKGVRVIVDLKELEKCDMITLVLLLNGIRKDIRLLNGGLRLCSLKSEIQTYFTENHLDHIFETYKNFETAKKIEWRN